MLVRKVKNKEYYRNAQDFDRLCCQWLDYSGIALGYTRQIHARLTDSAAFGKFMASNILQRHLTVAPHRADNRVKFESSESRERHPQEIIVHLEAQSAPVHVEQHQEALGDFQLFIQILGIRDSISEFSGVVIDLLSFEAPPPGRIVAANETLVPGLRQRRALLRYPHHRMRPSRRLRPGHLPYVKSRCVSHLSPDAVCGLIHGVSVEGEGVVRTDVYVCAAVQLVPGVLQLQRSVGRFLL